MMEKFNIGSSAAGFVYLRFKTQQMMNKQILIEKIKEANELFFITEIPFRYLFDDEIIEENETLAAIPPKAKRKQKEEQIETHTNIEREPNNEKTPNNEKQQK